MHSRASNIPTYIDDKPPIKKNIKSSTIFLITHDNLHLRHFLFQ